MVSVVAAKQVVNPNNYVQEAAGFLPDQSQRQRLPMRCGQDRPIVQSIKHFSSKPAIKYYTCYYYVFRIVFSQKFKRIILPFIPFHNQQERSPRGVTSDKLSKSDSQGVICSELQVFEKMPTLVDDDVVAGDSSHGADQKTELPGRVAQWYYRHGLFLSSYPACATSIAVVVILVAW